MHRRFALNSVIRGYHVYKTVWSPFVGEILHLQTDARNAHDAHAVTIVMNSVMVGHATREMRGYFFTFCSMVEVYPLKLLVTESTAMDWRVPCRYTLTGKRKHVKQAKKLFN